jgi:ribosomal 30S subunit maturation factor RimM
VRAVGLRGECKLYPLLDWHAPLLTSPFLIWENGEPIQVLSVRQQGRMPVARLAGVGDRESATRLVGRQLGFTPQSYLQPDFPKPGDGLPFRYLGREVQLVDGQVVGRVVEVRRYAHQVTLVVDRAGQEILIPALAPILIPAPGLTGPLQVDPPEGLCDDTAD